VDPTAAPRALVAVRLVAVAGAVLALGAGAHVAGGGAAPSPAVALLVAVLVLPVAAVVARRPLAVPVLLPVAVAAQVGVHVTLTWLGSGAGPVAAGDAVGSHRGHAAAVASGGTTVPVVPVTHADAAHGLVAGLPMLLAHVAAMAVMVLLLVATERGLLALARGWAVVLPALLGAAAVLVAPAARRALPVPGGVVRRPRTVPLRSGAGRRGPPAGLLLATAA
jgi:hypothetical protein